MYNKILKKLQEMQDIRNKWFREYGDGDYYSVFEKYDWIYESYKRNTTGSMLLHLLMQMIEHYKKQGHKKFDYLRGSDNYKYTWVNGSYTNYRVFGCSNSYGIFVKTLTKI